MVCLYICTLVHKKGICKIAQVMDDSKTFLSFENFQAKLPELKCNYLEYQGIVSAIKHYNCFLEFKEKLLLITSFNKTR